MPPTVFVPFDAFWLAFATLLVNCAGSLACLRTRHQRLWHELGRPRFLPAGRLAASAALTRFYWSRRVGELGDPSLSAWVTALRVNQIALAVVLVVLTRRLLHSGL